MTIKERFERFNNSVDKFADGKHIRCFVDAIFESVVFKYPTTFYFNYDFFAKKMHERHKFLSKRDAERYEALNPKDISILQDKVKFNNFFKEKLHRDFIYPKNSTFEDFCKFIKKHPTYIVKDNWRCEGQGISKYTITENEDLHALFNSYSKNYILLEEVLQQHTSLNKINASSVNTIRVSTVFHNNKAHIVAAALRMGKKGSITDNLYGGGVCCSVDIDTGIVQSPCCDKNNNRSLKHPTSQETVLGFQIPNWNSVITLAKESAELVPEFVWVGWDIAVTENGAALIEGNHNPSVDLIQIGCQGLKPKIENILKS